MATHDRYWSFYLESPKRQPKLQPWLISSKILKTMMLWALMRGNSSLMWWSFARKLQIKEKLLLWRLLTEHLREKLLETSLTWFQWLKKWQNCAQFASTAQRKLLSPREWLKAGRFNWLEVPRCTNLSVDDVSSLNNTLNLFMFKHVLKKHLRWTLHKIWVSIWTPKKRLWRKCLHDLLQHFNFHYNM